MARGGRGGQSRGPLPREVQVSKKLSWLLRHGAQSEGLTMDSRGYVNVQDVLSNRNLRSFKVSFDELRQLVADNEKQRFTLTPVAAPTTESSNGTAEQDQESKPFDSIPTNPRDWLIRATQGHSLKLESADLLTPIPLEDLPETVVHGTSHAAWPLILASGGLRVMGRNHVHFASGLPAGFKSVVEKDGQTDEVAPPVISGMRNSSTVLIFLDIRKAVQAGLKFWISDNKVILTEGNDEGVVPMEFFERVEDRTGEGVLVEDGKVVKEAPATWGVKKGKGKP